MKLSEQLKRGRIDRPDEWTMDRYIAKAKEMEDALEWIIAPDRPIGSDAEMVHVMEKTAQKILCDNKEHINTYARSRRANDPAMRWVHNTRANLHRILHSAGSHPETLDLLGCTGQEWRDHLESQFTEGMSWDSYGKGDGKWEIDHILPVSSFDQTDPEQRKICWHYSNTQPLWHTENVLKGNSIPTE